VQRGKERAKIFIYRFDVMLNTQIVKNLSWGELFIFPKKLRGSIIMIF
jgi:hypothetical protein